MTSFLLQRDQLQDGVGGVAADGGVLYPGSPAEQRLIVHALVVEDDTGGLFTLQRKAWGSTRWGVSHVQ